MNIVPYNEMEQMAASIASSGLFGFKTKEQVLAIMSIAQSEGKHPAKAIQEYHVINGKPSLKADAMQARFMENGGKIEWHELTDAKVSATFTHPAGGSACITWTMADAHRAGITGNPTWKKYPRAMLRSRVVSEGVRTVCPGVIGGMYTPEETESFTQPMIEVVDPVKQLKLAIRDNPALDLTEHAETLAIIQEQEPETYEKIMEYVNARR